METQSSGNEYELSDQEVPFKAGQVTRSGRRLKRPQSFFSEPTESRRKSAADALPATPAGRDDMDSVKRRRRQSKGPVSRLPSYEEYVQRELPNDVINATMFCTLCLMGDHTKNNQIMLCDNCDASFHQHCHEPAVDDAFVESSQIPWYCYRCVDTEKARDAQPDIDRALEEAHRNKAVRREEEDDAATATNPTPQESGQSTPARPAPTDEEEPSERCITCGLELDNEEDPAEIPLTRPGLPESHAGLVAALLKKTCSTCSPVFQKHFDALKVQPAEMLATLLTQTAMRYTYLEHYLRQQEERATPFDMQQLVAYSARSLYVALPTVSALKVLVGQEEPTIRAIESKARRMRPKKSDEPVTPAHVAKTPAPEYHSPFFEYRRRPPTIYGSYEDMIARAIMSIGNSRGSKPKEIFQWMQDSIPGLAENFRGSATQALKKGCDRGRFIKVENGWYRMNPKFQEDPSRKRRMASEAEVQRFSMHMSPSGHFMGTPHPPHHHPVPSQMMVPMGLSGPSTPGNPSQPQSDQEQSGTSTPSGNAGQQEAAAMVAASVHYGQAQGPSSSFPHHHMMMGMPYSSHPAFFHHQAAFHHHPFHAQQQAMQAAAAAAATMVQDQTENLENVLGFQNDSNENPIF